MRAETTSALLGGVLVVLTLFVCYAVILEFSNSTTKAQFVVQGRYKPSCSSPWLHSRRSECHCLTRGEMPAIDGQALGNLHRPCCLPGEPGVGLSHVPPPTAT